MRSTGEQLEEARVREAVGRHLGRQVRAAERLAPGLGLRRFWRLRLDGPPGRVVVRVEAPEDPAGRPAGVAPEPALEPLRSVLEAAGLPVPASYGHDAAAGFDLLEDVGDVNLAQLAAAATPEVREALYASVCELLPRLQAVADPGGLPAFRRRLDAPLLAYKAALFADASLPLALGRPATASERRVVDEAFAAIAATVDEAPRRLAHRDLQSHNLLARPGTGPPPHLVMIDLQGAFLAPPEYDLVCLLRDSYVELPEAEVRRHLARTRPHLPDAPDPATFFLRFDLLTVARKAKDHARFLDVARRRGDRSALRWVPPTTRTLHAAAPRVAALHPRLADLAQWIAALPAEAPPCAP